MKEHNCENCKASHELLKDRIRDLNDELAKSERRDKNQDLDIQAVHDLLEQSTQKLGKLNWNAIIMGALGILAVVIEALIR